MSSEDEPEGEEEHFWRRPSRSQQKRDADRVFALAVRLVDLKPAEFGVLGLDAELSEAVALGRVLTKNARSRQLRRIAKLLRKTDSDGVLAKLDGGKKHMTDSVLAEQEHEHWRSRLLGEGDSAVEELLIALEVTDVAEARRTLRQLVRVAKKEPPDTKSRRARLLLLRKIRALRTLPATD